nr:hypothetical protein [Tanacetum cinerariifolium]
PSPTIESTSDDAQNRNPSVTKSEASPSTISPKPFIKFVKAADCTEVKTNKVEAARKSSVESRDNCVESLTKELELINQEKEGLDSKLAGFQIASKDLDSLLESQRLDKNKEGLGYSAVLPPPAQVYSPPKKDLSWTRLPEFTDVL